MEVHAGRQRNELLALAPVRVLLDGVAHLVGLREVSEDVRPLLERAAHWLSRLRLAPAAGQLLGSLIIIAVVVLFTAQVSGTELAITVDDLPAQGSLPAGITRVDVIDRLLAVLRRHRVPGVVGFVNGGPVEDVPAYGDILQRWVAAGYRLGNHTFRHTDLDRAGPARFIVDIERNELVIARYSPAEPRRMFRYPYLREGATPSDRDAIRGVLRKRGYLIVPVTVAFYDWEWNDTYVRCTTTRGAGALTRAFVEAGLRALRWSEHTGRTLVQRPIKQILLLHANAIDALALDDLLSAYEAHGVRFIPVQDALDDPVYEIDPGPAWREGNFLNRLVLATGRSVAWPVLLPPQRCDGE
jgi:peptidoglycan/xylan/chitin deacetylase (PgdA/CDA1 family)